LSYEEINIEEIDMSREQLAELTGGMTVPQIVVNGTNIGGFDKLMILSQSGESGKTSVITSLLVRAAKVVLPTNF